MVGGCIGAQDSGETTPCKDTAVIFRGVASPEGRRGGGGDREPLSELDCYVREELPPPSPEHGMTSPNSIQTQAYGGGGVDREPLSEHHCDVGEDHRPCLGVRVWDLGFIV